MHYLLGAKIPDFVAHRSPQYPRLPHDQSMAGYASSTLHYSGTSSSLLRSRWPVCLTVLVTTAMVLAMDADLLRLSIIYGHMGTSVMYRG
jgi:hypothetical protein